MSVEMAIWRMTDGGPVSVSTTPLDLERRLEDMLVADTTMLGVDLLVLGRQVPTSFGGFVDVLAMDSEARVHVLELKRERTPRDVVAQTLDYASWARSLSVDDLDQILQHHQGGDLELSDAFAEAFDLALPDVVNADQHLTIVASELDPASDRIVEYLADVYGVPINAVFFRHFVDNDREYLARTWLLDPRESEVRSTRSRSKVRPWNGRDFYTVLGRIDDGAYRWEIARRYGLLNAGGSSWYWKPLRNLQAGHRVFAYVGGAGYVGVGEVLGAMRPAVDEMVEVDGIEMRLLDAPGVPEAFVERAMSSDPDVREMVVSVRWLTDRPTDQAVTETGLFASQVPVCKLRDDRTIEFLEGAFSLDDP